MNCDGDSFSFLKIFGHMMGSTFIISSVLHGSIRNSQVVNQLLDWRLDVIQSYYAFVLLHLEQKLWLNNLNPDKTEVLMVGRKPDSEMGI